MNKAFRSNKIDPRKTMDARRRAKVDPLSRKTRTTRIILAGSAFDSDRDQRFLEALQRAMKAQQQALEPESVDSQGSITAHSCEWWNQPGQLPGDCGCTDKISDAEAKEWIAVGLAEWIGYGAVVTSFPPIKVHTCRPIQVRDANDKRYRLFMPSCLLRKPCSETMDYRDAFHVVKYGNGVWFPDKLEILDTTELKDLEAWQIVLKMQKLAMGNGMAIGGKNLITAGGGTEVEHVDPKRYSLDAYGGKERTAAGIGGSGASPNVDQEPTDNYFKPGSPSPLMSQDAKLAERMKQAEITEAISEEIDVPPEHETPEERAARLKRARADKEKIQNISTEDVDKRIDSNGNREQS